MKNRSYCCPACKRKLTIDTSGTALSCSNEHSFSFVKGTKVPLFASEGDNANEYTTTQAAEIHENSLKWFFETFGGSEDELRKNMISKLRLEKGGKVLITGVGAGNDLPYFAQMIGKEGVIFAQDFASQMLMSAVERTTSIYHLSDYNIEFCVSDATNLPYLDNFFDAVYHFGGLNIFPDIAKGISEMDRVVKSGGRVVFGDEGLPPWLKRTEYGGMIINNNSLCAFEAPLSYLPVTAREVNLSWTGGYCFYVIDYTASNSALPINIDIPHIGKRGGTMRTRYFGKLEGVGPELKELLYAEAEKRGVSRVEFIECLLRNGLEG